MIPGELDACPRTLGQARRAGGALRVGGGLVATSRELFESYVGKREPETAACHTDGRQMFTMSA